MLVLSRAWAVQVVLCGLLLILQSCMTSCPQVGANAVGRVASHLAGMGQMRVQGCKSEAWGDGEFRTRRAWYGLKTESCVSSCPHVGADAVGRVASHLAGRGQLRLHWPYCMSEAWGDDGSRTRRAWYGLETDGAAVATPMWMPSVLRKGSLQKRLGPYGKPQLRGAKDTTSSIPYFSSNDANGVMLACHPARPPGQPPGCARLDSQPATAPPRSGRDFLGGTIVKTRAELHRLYDIDLKEDAVRDISFYLGPPFLLDRGSLLLQSCRPIAST